MYVEICNQFHYNEYTMKNEKTKAAGKAEYMTSLSGKRMVSKTHGRIVFRGRIDTLEAEVIEAQVLAAQLGEADICASLGEILDYLRSIMSAEVRERPLPPPVLFGMDAEELHYQSHNTEIRFGPVRLPAHTQGPLAARINTLRAKVREAELCAVRVFGPGAEEMAEPTAGTPARVSPTEREDIILALNRLSSALWWLFCKVCQQK